MNQQVTVYQTPHLFWILILVAIALAMAYSYDGLMMMAGAFESEEYSHGYLLPCVALYFIWQKRDELAQIKFSGTWAGFALAGSGLLLGFIGIESGVYPIIQYAFLVTLAGVLLALLGFRAFRLILAPLLILVFMVPLPAFLYQNLSSELQLISSKLGVAVIRLFDISVYLEGNVIDLGIYKLQVVEACSGLRYLFPLLSFGYICAYLFKAPLWQRLFVFLSTIPITILMNSFRIGVIGVLVEHKGIEQAEGFLHDFEGWIIFMACVGILFLEMLVFTRVFHNNKRLSQVFGLEVPAEIPKDAVLEKRGLPVPFASILPVLMLATAASLTTVTPEEIIPERQPFNSFPAQIDQWQGRRDYLDTIYLDALKGLSDYIIADYNNTPLAPVNFYVAYYESQKAGGAAHSPRSCIPGDGWLITSLETVALEDIRIQGTPLRINRVTIQKADQRQLVYYWFYQRGRVVTNEYLVKWYLFWDSLTKNRSDGALIRYVTRLSPDEDMLAADMRIQNFIRDSNRYLFDYLPD